MVNIIFNNSIDNRGAKTKQPQQGNLLPNAGTGQTSVQHSNSTIDGINTSGFTLNGITDFHSITN